MPSSLSLSIWSPVGFVCLFVFVFVFVFMRRIEEGCKDIRQGASRMDS